MTDKGIRIFWLGLLFLLLGSYFLAWHAVAKPKEAVMSDTGKLVKVDKGDKAPNSTPEETEIGTATIVMPTADTTCRVILEALSMPGGARGCYQLPGSCVDDVCIFDCLFRGNSCQSIAHRPGYIGSTSIEAEKHAKKSKIYKTTGKCSTDEGEVDCEVDIDDPRATSSTAWIPHKWLGRPDLDLEEVAR